MTSPADSARRSTPVDSVFDRNRGGVFYLVASVFIAIDILQITLTQAAVPGMTMARMAGVAALGVFLLIVAFYRLTGKLKLASIILMTVAYAATIFAALKQGGAPAPTLAYAPFMPLVTTVLLGRTAGAVSVVASIAMVVFCTYAAQSGVASPSPHSPEDLRLLFSAALVLLAIGVATYAFIYESLIVNAINQIHEAHREVEAKANELSENREFLSAVMECAHDGVIAAGADGKLFVFNRAAREFHGIDASPLTQDAWPSTYHLYEADGKTPMAPQDVPLARAFHGEKIVNCEMAVCTPGEAPRYIVGAASPLYGSHSERLGAVATFRDVTLEMHQREEIRKQNREIDQFARVASVDLQAPLNRIMMKADSLLTAPEARASAMLRTDLKAIAAAAAKMGALIKDVLYMSRLPVGEISLQPVVVRDCIDAAIALSEISEADCRLDFRFGGSPDVSADPKSLTTVFKILIENAWKHAPDGVKPHVEFTCQLDSGFAVLGVKDNGNGMTPDQIARLFMPLERLRTEPDQEGTGLGLAICRKSVQRMGGEFWVESPRGDGCHFRMRLPIADSGVAIAS